MRAIAYIFLNPTSGFWLRRALAPIARNPLFATVFIHNGGEALVTEFVVIMESMVPW